MDYQCDKHNCKYGKFFNNEHIPMMVIDSQTGDIYDVNFAACNFYSYCREELLVMNIKDINILKEEDIYNIIKKAGEENRNRFRLKHNPSTSETRDVDIYSVPIELQNQELLVFITRDIKEQRKLEQENQNLFWMKYSLTKAIANGEFFLNYQPIYNIKTNKLVGVESLIRWNHRELGIIPPSVFIPIAEETGLIYSIGEWVLFNACKQNKIWQDLGYDPIYMSVNISPLELECPDFTSRVKRILEESKLESRYLQLEITETFFVQNFEAIKKNIKQINGLGIKIAIDDFGTGYSSLEKLYKLNINNLKIDRVFINGVDKNSNKSKIVKSVISLAKSLNIDLIAEGVETEEQLNFLKKNRCNMAQGYLFSKPISQIELEKYLHKN